MKLSWYGLKMTIVGGKLSHLVQKDKIWDHGSMIEQVKNIFYHVEKAKKKNDPEMVRKYLTARAFAQLGQFNVIKIDDPVTGNVILTEISILHVNPAKKNFPDRFTALIRGKRKGQIKDLTNTDQKYGIENFSKRWLFVREGNWWLLDEMKI